MGEKKALSQFWQCSGPITSCMHACLENGRHVIPLIPSYDCAVIIYYEQTHIRMS